MKLVIADHIPENGLLRVQSYSGLPAIGDCVRVVLPNSQQVDGVVIETTPAPGTSENDKYTVQIEVQE